MRLERLTLAGFRNLEDARLDLPSDGVGLIGRNAQGKSNLLEAIHYLDTFRSFRRAHDEQLVRMGEDVFRIHAELRMDAGTSRTISAAFQRSTGTKRVRYDDQAADRLADVVGTTGTVLFTPDDVGLVSGGPDERRRFLDILLSVNVPGYLSALQRYRHALSQRNAALRAGVGREALGVWDPVLTGAGAEVCRARAAWVRSNEAALADRYGRIAGSGSIAMRYEPSVRGIDEEEGAERAGERFLVALREARPHEARRRTTVVGPHRDEVAFLALDHPTSAERDLRRYGSGGERRTAALALRLVEADTRRAALGEAPILLLDDVFAELDEERSARIAELIDEALEGQVIVAVPKETDVRVRSEWLARWHIEGGRIGT